VPYWLGTLESLNLFRRTRDWSDNDRTLSDQMSGAIVAFATSGNPNRSGAPDWPAYATHRERIVEFGETTRVVSWPNRSNLEFFASNPPVRPVSGGSARD
jgi:para-nitrobenzyl esterase